MDAARYRKAIVAVVGAAVLVAGQFGLVFTDELPESVGVIFDGVVAALTAFGVYRVPNAPPSRDEVRRAVPPGRSSWGKRPKP